MGHVARLWPLDTFICLATGPSLTKTDVDACRGHGRVIAVNDAYRFAPWADVLYAADLAWWDAHPAGASFAGLKFACKPTATTRDKPKHAHITTLIKTGETGLETQSHGLRSGGNSGYQAINLARHLGASRIILLGYDMHRNGKHAHFFGSHQPPLADPADYRWLQWRANFATLLKPLSEEGISVINCTRDTALTCFARKSLTDMLT